MFVDEDKNRLKIKSFRAGGRLQDRASTQFKEKTGFLSLN
ncbi:Uncharacterized protein NEOC95_001991 [Neochlamydia sp. AcF95]|nr:Uncharacterized protein [Neochlamydia sp. AcF95]